MLVMHVSKCVYMFVCFVHIYNIFVLLCVCLFLCVFIYENVDGTYINNNGTVMTVHGIGNKQTNNKHALDV